VKVLPAQALNPAQVKVLPAQALNPAQVKVLPALVLPAQEAAVITSQVVANVWITHRTAPGTFSLACVKKKKIHPRCFHTHGITKNLMAHTVPYPIASRPFLKIPPITKTH